MFSLIFIILLIIGYLLGSVNTAVLVCKFMNLPDPRTEGSHNPGATNVLRIAGKQAAGFVLLADGLKGFIPVVLGRFVGITDFPLGLIAIAALLGHIFPIFFQFKGGKGAATAIGGIFGLNFFVGILAAITWGLIVYFTRYVSLASIAAVALSIIYILIFSKVTYVIPVLIMAIILIWRHWENIKRLRAGTESKISLA
jgi:acyl phosphate:glycerol-3-phosphate acyltransferase